LAITTGSKPVDTGSNPVVPTYSHTDSKCGDKKMINDDKQENIEIKANKELCPFLLIEDFEFHLFFVDIVDSYDCSKGRRELTMFEPCYMGYTRTCSIYQKNIQGVK
jgi:hypothetical protein